MTRINENEEDGTIMNEIEDAFENCDELHIGREERPKIELAYQENQLVKKFNPFKNLKFTGKNDSTHPKRFIKNFEYFAMHENLNEYEKEYYFIQSLVEDAGIWLNLRGYGSYEEMTEDFIKFYWNADVQRSFLNHLRNGEYDKNCGLSMDDYLFKYANEAKFLDKPQPEEDVIFDLLQHFDLPEEIEELFDIHPVETIEEALSILRKAEAFESYERSLEPENEIMKNESESQIAPEQELSILKEKEECNKDELIILRLLVCIFSMFLITLLFTLFNGYSTEQEVLIEKQQKLLETVQNFN